MSEYFLNHIIQNGMTDCVGIDGQSLLNKYKLRADNAEFEENDENYDFFFKYIFDACDKNIVQCMRNGLTTATIYNGIIDSSHYKLLFNNIDDGGRIKKSILSEIIKIYKDPFKVEYFEFDNNKFSIMITWPNDNPNNNKNYDYSCDYCYCSSCQLL